MKGLTREEIKAGKMYWCQLSQRNVIIEAVFLKGDIPMIVAWAYNFAKGKYQEIVVRDYQLAEIETKR